jgi:hypothetical protein
MLMLDAGDCGFMPINHDSITNGPVTPLIPGYDFPSGFAPALSEEVCNDLVKLNGSEALIEWAQDHIIVRIVFSTLDHLGKEYIHHGKC